MSNTSETTTTTESMWEQRALEVEAKLTSVLSEMEYLKEQIRVLQRKRFGSSSEKTKGIADQMKLFDSMFNEVEATAEPFAPEPDLITVPEHNRCTSDSLLHVDNLIQYTEDDFVEETLMDNKE